MNVWPALQERVEAPAADRWLNMLRVEEQERVLLLEAPNRFSASWIQERFLGELQEHLEELRPGWSIELTVGRGAPVEYQPEGPSDSQLPLPCAPLDRWARCEYTFERFVSGASNALAYEVAQGMVRGDSQLRALFLLAGPGLGKTHLGTAVAHAVKTRAPQLKVRCLGAEQFVGEMVRAIQARSIDAFQEKYQKADLLVLEEVHFVGGKDRTQREVAGVLDCLMDHRCRVVLSSVLPPGEIPNLRSSLKSRFHQAILAEVGSPDTEMREKILQQRAEEVGFVLPDDVLELLAGETEGRDVRSLEGVLAQIRARGEMLREKITPMLAREVLELYRDGGSDAGVTLRKVLEVVSKVYGVEPRDVQARGRQKPLSTARSVYCFLAREHTPASLKEIGALVNRSHGTVLYSIERVAQKSRRDAGLHKQLEFLSERLEGKR